MMKHLRISGMQGAYSADKIKNSLEMVTHVDTADVNYQTSAARVSFGKNEPDEQALLNAVGDAGYTAEVLTEERKKK